MADDGRVLLKCFLFYCIFLSSGIVGQRINGLEGMEGLADLAGSLGGLFNTLNECAYECKAGKVVVYCATALIYF